MTYVGPSQVLVKPLNADADGGTSAGGVIFKSQYGHEIEDVRVMGEDRYLIGRTRDTLLLGEQQLVDECVSYTPFYCGSFDENSAFLWSQNTSALSTKNE